MKTRTSCAPAGPSPIEQVMETVAADVTSQLTPPIVTMLLLIVMSSNPVPMIVIAVFADNEPEMYSKNMLFTPKFDVKHKQRMLMLM